MKSLPRIIGLSVCCSIVSCGDVSYEKHAPTYTGIVNSCSKDSDCKSGSTCDEGRSMCVSKEGVLGTTLYVKVIPKSGAPEIFPVTFDNSGRETVSLSEPRTITVSVNVDGATAAAYVLATDLRSLSGGFASVVSTTTPDAVPAVLSLLEGKHRYQIDVTPNYDVSSSLTVYPPRSFKDLSVEWDSDSDAAVLIDANENYLPSLNLPGGTQLLGRVRRGRQPINGLYVEEVDSLESFPLSGRVMTGCNNNESEGTVCGDFELFRNIAETDTDTNSDSDPSADAKKTFTLKIWSKNDPAYPVTLIPSTAAETDETTGGLIFTLPVLEPPIPFGDADGSGNGVVVERPQMVSSGEEPIYTALENCLVVFESNEFFSPDGEALGETCTREEGDTSVCIEETVRFNGVTDSRGNIVGLDGKMIYLYPRRYTVSIIPPLADTNTNEDYSLLTVPYLKATDAVDNQVIRLNFRYRVKIRVTGKGKDIPGASIEAIPIGDASPYAKHEFSVPQEDKSYRLMLDAGRYRLVAKVPFESGYAFSIKDVDIGKDDDDLSKTPEDVNLGILEAPIPTLATVHIESKDLNLEGATVEWYKVYATESDTDTDEGDTDSDEGNSDTGVSEHVNEIGGSKTVLVGRSPVDSDGNAIGLIPPPLAEPNP